MERRMVIIIVVVIGIIMLGLGLTAYFAMRTSENILKTFQRVNNGLEVTRSTLGDMYSEGHDLLNSAGCNDLIALADSLHLAKEHLATRIDSFKMQLVEAPMDDIDVAIEVFDTQERGADLYAAFHSYFELAEALVTSDSIRSRIDDHANIVRAEPLEEWRTRNFFRVPRVAGVAILSKYASDATAVEGLVMKDLLARCQGPGFEENAWKP